MTTTADAPDTDTRDTQEENEPIRMVQAQIDGPKLRQWMAERELSSRDHAIHCLLVESFGETAPKPFKLNMRNQAPAGTLYGYTHYDAEDLRDAAATWANPLQMQIIPADSINSKLMPHEWTQGRTIGFETRIRPIVRVQNDLSDPKGKRREREYDVFTLRAGNWPKEQQGIEARQTVYIEWLAQTLDRTEGATLLPQHTRMAQYQDQKEIRGKGKRMVKGPDVLIQGLMVITDSEKFNRILSRGIGRHRAYGYGMVLLRPAISHK